MLVRLYPRHPQLGYVLRSYTILEPALRFLESRGWYEVDEDVAEMIRDIPQQERYPTGPRAFMIAADKAEAKKLDARLETLILKAKKEVKVGTADEPVKATRPGSKPKTRKKKPKPAPAPEEATE